METDKGYVSSVWQDQKSWKFCVIIQKDKIYRDTFPQVLGLRNYLVSTKQRRSDGPTWTNENLARFATDWP